MSAGERITIAYINLYTEMGGGEYAIYNLVKGLDKNRFRPIVIFNKEGQFPKMVRELGVEVAIVDYPTVMLQDMIVPRVLASVRSGSKALGRFLEESRVQIVHTVDVLALIMIAPAVKKLRIPVLYNVIFFYELTRVVLFNLLALPLVRKIITNSKAIRDNLLARTLFPRAEGRDGVLRHRHRTVQDEKPRRKEPAPRGAQASTGEDAHRDDRPVGHLEGTFDVPERRRVDAEEESGPAFRGRGGSA